MLPLCERARTAAPKTPIPPLRRDRSLLRVSNAAYSQLRPLMSARRWNVREPLPAGPPATAVGCAVEVEVHRRAVGEAEVHRAPVVLRDAAEIAGETAARVVVDRHVRERVRAVMRRRPATDSQNGMPFAS